MNQITHSQLKILLLGFGHVAQAFLPLLASRSQWLESNFGVYPTIHGIGTLEGLYINPTGINADLLSHHDDPFQEFSDKGIAVKDTEAFIQIGKNVGASMLIELTHLNPGNGQPALAHISRALEAGMDVVTANKGPVAFAQVDLQELASRNHVQFRFESTVMDGLPVFNLVHFTLPAANVISFRAILNTTSSIVLDMMGNGFELGEAIAKAQQMGVAEADPWYDLDGWDAVMKTTILANILLKGQLVPRMVKREGIRNVTSDDILAATRKGAFIRLVSQANYTNGILHAEVSPHQILFDDILHVGKDTTNVISLETEAMGTVTLVEHEPTVTQTAYGIFSDLVTILRNRPMI